MTRPFFLWDHLRQIFFGVIGLAAAMLFWVLASFFLLLNLLISWNHLWRYIGIWNLAMYRFIMRRRNLYDTSLLPTQPPPSDPRMDRWDPLYRATRTADGTFNDLQDPCMGSAGTRFARNFPLKRLNELFREQTAGNRSHLLSPNPRTISRTLLTRDRFRAASSLNLLAAAWIQFQVHDWFNHRRRPPLPPGQPPPPEQRNELPPVELDPQDDWPGRNAGESTMQIRATLPDDTIDRQSPDFGPGRRFEGLADFPVYRNTETHWWDASQLYGSSQDKQSRLRQDDGSGKLLTVAGRLPVDPTRAGIDLTGFNDNWWAGLNLLHTLFALEHNAICDELKGAYPDWSGERLFQTARLINAALIAKIHTVEWTPAILGHPTLYIGMRANWWGILTQRLTTIIGRLRVLRDLQEEVSGIPSSEQDHHASPFSMTEEFVSVYRMHPLIPDEYRVYDLQTDELAVGCSFNDLQGDNTRDFVERAGVNNLLYSFGVAHPGAVTLNNFPRALQHFRRMKDEDHTFPQGEPLDLGTIDIMRDRERAVPRYNNFRRMLMMAPCISYNRLVGVPLIKCFSGLSNRQIKERKAWARQLKTSYPDKEDLDLMVGLHAEVLPRGFGFSDTAFRIFVLMAPRRLKSDRFITTDFNADVYTQVGLDWIEQNTFKSVLLRHHPELAPALDDIKNAFTPWQRTERPSPAPFDPDPAADPRPEMRGVSMFQMPMFGGAFIGWLIGAGVQASRPHFAFSQFLPSLGTETAAYGAVIGAILGGATLATLYGASFLATRVLTLREQMQTAAGIGATIGWIVGARYHVWNHGQSLSGLWDVAMTLGSALLTRTALIGAVCGAAVGFIREQSPWRVRTGTAVGWILGAAWYLWDEGVSFSGLEDLTTLFHGLGEREALIGAFCGATIAVVYAGRKPLREIFAEGGIRRFISRTLYGLLFGTLFGVIIGTLFGVFVSLIDNSWQVLATASMGLASLAVVIAVAALRDALVRTGPSRRRDSLVTALGTLATVGLVWGILELAGGPASFLTAALATLDVVSFHVAVGAVIGAAAGLSLLMMGWVAVAAFVGWLLGGLLHLIFHHQWHLAEALASSNASAGAVLGAVLGVSVTWVLVRDWTWMVVWGLRGALVGYALGVGTFLLDKASEEDFCSYLWLAVTSPPAWWGALLSALFIGSVWMVRPAEVTWSLRGRFWRLVGWFKFAGNRPVNIPPPRRRWWWKQVVWLKFWAEARAMNARLHGRHLEPFWNCLKERLDNRLRRSKAAWRLDDISVVPFNVRFPTIPIPNIRVSGNIPADERERKKAFFSNIQVRLYSIFSPMQDDNPLPPVSSNPTETFRTAYSFLQRRAFDPPDLPPEYEGSPDLGSLAIKGPYACHTERVPADEHRPGLREYQWDFRDLALPENLYHQGLYRLGVRVFFRSSRRRPGRLEATEIENITERTLRSSRPWFDNWDLAKKLALCAATTHLSLVRHFNCVHLASAEPLAIATRNCLPSDHPVCRLLWPHIYGTLQSNHMVTLVQMVKDGDFETIFSFTHEGMCRLFTESYTRFNFVVNDPEEDANRRGVRQYLEGLRTAGIDTGQQNLEALFNVIHQHVQRYLGAYYPPHLNIGDDPDMVNWVRALNEHVPCPAGVNHAVGVDHHALTLANVARLIARFIYLVTVQHESVGTSLWNYQLWTHRQPIRVYRSGRREPLDVYQRLVNANFNLNVTRRALMNDFSYLALDRRGAAAFSQFRRELQDLQQSMEKDPWEVWKIYPDMLEANINA